MNVDEGRRFCWRVHESISLVRNRQDNWYVFFSIACKWESKSFLELRSWNSRDTVDASEIQTTTWDATKPCKSWDKLPTSTGDRRISCINSMTLSQKHFRNWATQITRCQHPQGSTPYAESVWLGRPGDSRCRQCNFDLGAGWYQEEGTCSKKSCLPQRHILLHQVLFFFSRYCIFQWSRNMGSLKGLEVF